MKKISVNQPVGAMDSAVAVLATLGSVVVERCPEPSCDVCARVLEAAA
jgi:hypothetical protein